MEEAFLKKKKKKKKKSTELLAGRLQHLDAMLLGQAGSFVVGLTK